MNPNSQTTSQVLTTSSPESSVQLTTFAQMHTAQKQSVIKRFKKAFKSSEKVRVTLSSPESTILAQDPESIEQAPAITPKPVMQRALSIPSMASFEGSTVSSIVVEKRSSPSRRASKRLKNIFRISPKKRQQSSYIPKRVVRHPTSPSRSVSPPSSPSTSPVPNSPLTATGIAKELLKNITEKQFNGEFMKMAIGGANGALTQITDVFAKLKPVTLTNAFVLICDPSLDMRTKGLFQLLETCGFVYNCTRNTIDFFIYAFQQFTKWIAPDIIVRQSAAGDLFEALKAKVSNTEVANIVSIVIAFIALAVGAPLLHIINKFKLTKSLNKNLVDVSKNVKALDSGFPVFKKIGTTILSSIGIELPNPDKDALAVPFDELQKQTAYIEDVKERIVANPAVIFTQNIDMVALIATADRLETEWSKYAMNKNVSFANSTLTRLRASRTILVTSSYAINACVKSKQEPTVLYCYGASGVGKSSTLTHIVKALGVLHDEDLKVYHRNCSDPYWSRYYQEDVVVIDEFGAGLDGPEGQELLNMRSPTAYALNMAGVHEKGKTFSSRYIVIYSNYPDPPFTSMRDRGPLRRRRDFFVEATNPALFDWLAQNPGQGNDAWPGWEEDCSHLTLTKMSFDKAHTSNSDVKVVNSAPNVARTYTIDSLAQEMYAAQCGHKGRFMRALATDLPRIALPVYTADGVTYPKLATPKPQAPIPIAVDAGLGDTTPYTATAQEADRQREAAMLAKSEVPLLQKNNLAAQVAKQNYSEDELQTQFKAVCANLLTTARRETDMHNRACNDFLGADELDDDEEDEILQQAYDDGHIDSPNKEDPPTAAEVRAIIFDDNDWFDDGTRGDFIRHCVMSNSALFTQSQTLQRSIQSFAATQGEQLVGTCFVLLGSPGLGKTTFTKNFDVYTIDEGFSTQNVSSSVNAVTTACDNGQSIIITTNYDDFNRFANGDSERYNKVMRRAHLVEFHRRSFFKTKPPTPEQLANDYYKHVKISIDGKPTNLSEVGKLIEKAPRKVTTHFSLRPVYTTDLPSDLELTSVGKLVDLKLINPSNFTKYLSISKGSLSKVARHAGIFTKIAGIITAGDSDVSSPEAFCVAVNAAQAPYTEKITIKLVLHDATLIFGSQFDKFCCAIVTTRCVVKVGDQFFFQETDEHGTHRQPMTSAEQEFLQSRETPPDADEEVDISPLASAIIDGFDILAKIIAVSTAGYLAVDNLITLGKLAKPHYAANQAMKRAKKIKFESDWGDTSFDDEYVSTMPIPSTPPPKLKTKKTHKVRKPMQISDTAPKYTADLIVIESAYDTRKLNPRLVALESATPPLPAGTAIAPETSYLSNWSGKVRKRRGKVLLESCFTPAQYTGIYKIANVPLAKLGNHLLSEEFNNSFSLYYQTFPQCVQRCLDMLHEAVEQQDEKLLIQFFHMLGLTMWQLDVEGLTVDANHREIMGQLRMGEPMAEGCPDPGYRSVLSQITRNKVLILSESGSVTSQGVMLGNKNGVCNLHSVTNAYNWNGEPYDWPMFHITWKGLKYACRIISINKPKDLLFFTIDDNFAPMAKSIIHHLRSGKDKFNARIPIAMVTRDEDDTNTTFIFNGSHITTARIGTKEQQVYIYSASSTINYSVNVTKPGDCGAILVGIDSKLQHKFLGIHAAGSDTQAYGSCILREDLPRAVLIQNRESGILPEATPRPKPRPRPVPESLPQVISGNIQFTEEETEHEHFELIGRTTNQAGELSKPYQSTRTSIMKSPLVTCKPGNEEFEPAILSRNDPRNVEKISPLQKNVEKWNRPRKTLPQDVVESYMEEIGDFYGALLSDKGYEYKKLTKTEAICGVSSLDMSNPLNMATSAGYPYNTYPGVRCKQPMLERTDDGYVISKKPLGKKLNHDIDQLTSGLARGETPIVVFQACLKDEARPMAKIYSVSTRSIVMSPLPMTITHRQFLHTVGIPMLETRREHPIKVGIAPNTNEWHHLYQYLTQYGLYGWSSDVQAFDAGVSKTILNALGTHFYPTVASLIGMDREYDRQVIEGLYRVLGEAHIMADGLLFKTEGGVVSGQPHTALDDSVVQLFYHYAIYRDVNAPGFPQTFQGFLDNVAIAIQGDDNTVVPKPELLEYYNFDVIKQRAYDLFMITITNEVKSNGEDDKPYEHISKLSFLKRSFCQHETGSITGPLRPDAFDKMFSTCSTVKPYRYGTTDQPKYDLEALKSTMESACYEASLVNKKFYNDLVTKFRKISKDLGIEFKCPGRFHDVFRSLYYEKAYKTLYV